MPKSMFMCIGRWKLPQSSPTVQELIGPKLPETIAKSRMLANISGG